MANHTIAVIGAGFSGTLLSLHLLDRAPPGTRILLIERGGSFGPGLAYSASNPNHLLNVPAGRMSAFEHKPRDFVDWLQRQPAPVLDNAEPTAGAFVPRRLFGAYLCHLLNTALSRQSHNTLELKHDSITAITQAQHELVLHLASGQFVRAGRAVLATGNQRPEPVPVSEPSFYSSTHWRSDALTANAFTDLSPEAPLLLIGTGLTMVDAVVTLLEKGHVGPIHALSRRGLVPEAHVSAQPASKFAPATYPADIGQLTRLLRTQVARAIAAGDAWQPVIDALRPFTQGLWQTMPASHRMRFLRHLRPWWDVHRHRMPQQIAARIDAARLSGQLHIHAGRITGYDLKGDMVDVRFCPRSTGQSATLRVTRVVNCSGPSTNYERIADPLTQNLLCTGWAQPDALRLGLDVTDTCALRSRAGMNASQRLFAVGPLTRGAFWEITAVPDIRRQCETVATHLSSVMQAQTTKPRRRLRYAA